MPRWWNRLFGDRGERLAVRHLKKSGLKIVARNYRNRFGEIDIIALDGQTIVFVEVKTRKSNAAGSPLEAVDESKQSKVIRVAEAYLKQRRLFEHSIRFDVIGIVWNEDEKESKPELTHVRHAFTG
jgi:putative endonuclease